MENSVDPGTFREDVIIAKLMRKIKPLQNGKITLSFIDMGKSCLNCNFFTSLICLLMLFAKINFSGKFPNLQYWFHFMAITVRGSPGCIAQSVMCCDYRCMSDCRSRGNKFNPGPVPYFHGD